MDYSLTFARHFARLVWLLLNEGNAFDAQIATLRSLVNVSRDGDVRLHAQDWRLMANGQPLPDRFTGAQDLVAQLIGHSVRALRVSQGASPADLLLAARVLASEAAPDDGGRNVLARLAALNASTVHVEIDGTVADTVAGGDGGRRRRRRPRRAVARAGGGDRRDHRDHRRGGDVRCGVARRSRRSATRARCSRGRRTRR